MGRRLPLVVLLTGVLAALPALAAADPVASVTTAKWHGDRLNLNLLAKSVPVGIAASQVSAIVTIGDTAVPAQVIIASSEVPDTSTAQTLMLVIDSSGSMTGARWRATQRAVDRFLDAAPLSARIGVVAFSNKARLQLAPTDDHDAVRRVVSNIRPNGDTALFDAVSIATRTLGNRAPCALLVLTDGEDTTSEATLESAASLLGESTCTTSFVGLQTSRPAFTTLRQLAEAGRGRAYSAENAEGIAGVFVQSFSTSNASIVLAADFPAGFTARDQSMSIALIIASSTIGLTARAEPTGAAQTSPVVSTTLLALALGMFVGVALLVWLLAEGSKRARTRRIETLIEAYALQRVVSDQAPQQDTLLETVEDLVRSFLVRANRRRRTELQLDGAALSMTPEQWLLIRLGITLLGAAIFAAATASGAAALVVGAPLGFLAPQIWLTRRRKRRSKGFEAGLPDMLMLMASSLRSGFSLDQAIVAASDQSSSEVSAELRRAVQEIRIGSPLEEALERVADRMDSSDFHWVVTALRIQRRSGGNLSELLITVSHTVRERAQLAREVAALTAEGRLSAYVLIGLPFGLFAFLLVTQPDYLRPLYTTTAGLTISAIGAVMLVIGWLLMDRLVKVEV